MEKQLQPNFQSFDFFKKRKNKFESLDKFIAACFCFGLLFVSTTCVSLIDLSEDIKQSQIDQAKFTQIVKSNVKDLSASLKRGDWSNAQYELMKLNALSSTQINKESLGVLSDYAKNNFTSKPYSNEFSLLVTSYLVYMQEKPAKENENIKKMKSNFYYSSWGFSENVVNKQIKNYQSDISEIKEKSSFLIKGLDDIELKSRLSDRFNSM